MLQKYGRKFEPPEQGARALQTTDDRQTTGGRAIAYSEREREFTFAKKEIPIQNSNVTESVMCDV